MSNRAELREEGYRFDDPPKDGTWLQVSDGISKVRTIQFDATAFGGKGGWFTKQGHGAKGPDEKHGWKWAFVPAFPA